MMRTSYRSTYETLNGWQYDASGALRPSNREGFVALLDNSDFGVRPGWVSGLQDIRQVAPYDSITLIPGNCPDREVGA